MTVVDVMSICAASYTSTLEFVLKLNFQTCATQYVFVHTYEICDFSVVYVVMVSTVGKEIWSWYRVLVRS